MAKATTRQLNGHLTGDSWGSPGKSPVFWRAATPTEAPVPGSLATTVTGAGGLYS